MHIVRNLGLFFCGRFRERVCFCVYVYHGIVLFWISKLISILNYVLTTDGNIFQVRYIGVSNETSYGVMEFVNLAKALGLPKIVSIQNSYSLLVRCPFEGRLPVLIFIRFVLW